MKREKGGEEIILFPTRIIAIGFAHSAYAVMPQCDGCPLLKPYLEKKGVVFIEKENDAFWRVRLSGGLRTKIYPGSSWWFVVDGDGHEVAFVNGKNPRKNIVPVAYICRPIDVRFIPFGEREACIAFYMDIIVQMDSIIEAIRLLDERFHGWKCPCACVEITRDCLERALGDESENVVYGKPLVSETRTSLKKCFPEHACEYILTPRKRQ